MTEREHEGEKKMARLRRQAGKAPRTLAFSVPMLGPSKKRLSPPIRAR